MSGWHWFSKGGRASAGVSLTRRDGLRADICVDDTTVDMQVAPSRNLSVGLTLDANGDDPITGHVGAWPLPTVYLSANAPILRRRAAAPRHRARGGSRLAVVGARPRRGVRPMARRGRPVALAGNDPRGAR